MAPGAQLGLRVPPDLEVLGFIGVDLHSLATDTEVMLDYVTLGVSYTSYLASSTDCAILRANVSIPLLFELTNQMRR